MTAATRTVTIEGEAAAKLKELAELSGRSEEWFANFMIEEHAEHELSIVKKIQQGLDDVRAGRVSSYEEVKAQMRAKIARANQRPAAE